MKKIKAIVYGLGTIGGGAAKLLLKKEEVEITGAIDGAEHKVGKDLGEVLGIDKELGITVSNDPNLVFSKAKADVVVHATTSLLKDIHPELEKAIKAGANVVSSAEELLYPYATHPENAQKLDRLAKEYGVTVLGTGVNPGFIWDTFIVGLTVACQSVKKIKATRVFDTSPYGLTVLKTLGTGYTVDEFRKELAEGKLRGHVGADGSISMIADCLGWKLDEMKKTAEPLIAKTQLQTHRGVKVDKGNVCGIEHVYSGMKEGKEVITLKWQASIDPATYPPLDTVSIDGIPPININIERGIPSELVTQAMLVNMIPKVISAPPGLVSMKELPLPSFFKIW